MGTVGQVTGERWRSRVRGCLLGGALGDAIGAGFEGAAVVDPGAVDDVIGSGSELRWTDDTALQCAVAGYLARLARVEDFDDDAHARALAEAWQQDPYRGYGANPPHLFAIVLAGGDWRTASRQAFGGAGSLGNGGAMRSAPIGVVSAASAVVADLARRGAAVTHAHPVGQDGAAVIAAATAHLLRLAAGPRPEIADFLQACRSPLRTSMTDAVTAVPDTLGLTDPQAVAGITGNGILADEAAAAALSAFLHHPASPVDAIRFAVAMGGDTDTIAAMAGSLAGAYAGSDALPEKLLARLEDRDHIQQLADDLADRWRA